MHVYRGKATQGRNEKVAVRKPRREASALCAGIGRLDSHLYKLVSHHLALCALEAGVISHLI